MIITRTPLRISFFSGGSDLPSFYTKEPGAALSATINKYVYVVVHDTPEETKHVHNELEMPSDVERMQHNITRETLKMFGIEKGITVTEITDVPCQGSGLGASSAYTVGLLRSLICRHNKNSNNLTNKADAPSLAETASDIEIEKCGYPIGKQDQYAAAVGGVNLFRFNSNHSVDSLPIGPCKNQLKLLAENLILVYTGKKREASKILNHLKDNMDARFGLVKRQRDMAYQGAEYLRNYQFDKFGALLHNAWTLKKESNALTTYKEVDNLYEEVYRLGALGGKVLGAGGGGYMLLYVPEPRRNAVVDLTQQRGFKVFPFQFSHEGSQVIFEEK